MQTKKQSFIEALSNTAVGFIISYASTFLIFPLVGLETNAGTNLIITIYFTIISIFRSYVIRRWFNKKKHPKMVQKSIFMHCFHCETEMPVQNINGVLSCNNCGLRHITS